MTIIETIGYKTLEEFVAMAEETGISYNGNDIPKSVQSAVVEIVKDYLNKIMVDANINGIKGRRC